MRIKEKNSNAHHEENALNFGVTGLFSCGKSIFKSSVQTGSNCRINVTFLTIYTYPYALTLLEALNYPPVGCVHISVLVYSTFGSLP